MSGYHTVDQLKEKGITVHGTNVLVSDCARIYNPKNLILHDNIRIDDFTIISCNGKVEIFNYVHIGSHCLISCSTNIIFCNYSGVSSGVKLFGSTDDYSGKFMSNAAVPNKYKNVTSGDIILEEHALIGANSVILPNVIVKKGTSTGAFTLLNKTTEEWKIYVGIPAKILRERDRNCLKLQHEIETE